jgi:hypothetical protein
MSKALPVVQPVPNDLSDFEIVAPILRGATEFDEAGNLIIPDGQ